MNYLSLLLFRPCLCCIIYLIKHKVYSIYKYTAGLVGTDRKVVQSPHVHAHASTHTFTHARSCCHATGFWRVAVE